MPAALCASGYCCAVRQSSAPDQMLDSGALRPLLFHNPAMHALVPAAMSVVQQPVRLADEHAPERVAVGVGEVRIEPGEAVHRAFDAEHADPAMTPAFAVEAGPVAREVGGEGEAQRGEGAAHPLVGVSRRPAVKPASPSRRRS